MISLLIFLLKNNGKKNLPAKDLPLSSRLIKDGVLVPVTVNSC